MGNEVTALALQVHGGMGFIEETGAAQHYRDARITTIYEGTTGIQAADLVGRKLLRDGGQMVSEMISEIRDDISIASLQDDPVVQEIAVAVAASVTHLEDATQSILESAKDNPKSPFFDSFNYLMLWGVAAGGWQMAKAAREAKNMLDAQEGSQAFLRAKMLSSLYYARQISPQSTALSQAVCAPNLPAEDLDELVA